MALRLSRRNGQKVSGGCGILFGIGWTAFSMIFVVAGIWVFWDSVRSSTWEEVPCELIRFEITDHPDKDPPFEARVDFSYRYEGTWYEGDRLTTEDDNGEEDYEKLVELGHELRNDFELSCRVNPEDPAEAVLTSSDEQAWFGLLFAAFGGGFVLVGIGLIIGTVRGKKKTKAKTVSSNSNDGMGRVVGCGFFGLFAAVGLGLLFGMVVPKAIEYFDMKGWVETPAEVVWSRVRSHSSDDGTTYSTDIFYRYQFNGTEYRSNRDGVVGGSSSGRSGKAKVVRQHPPGTPITCYVDPDEPWRAVRERKLGWWGLFALFPLPFAAVGLGGLWFTFIRKKKPKTSRSRPENRTQGTHQAAEDPSLPKLSGSGASIGKRMLHVLGAVLLAGFWNGIVGIFVVMAWKGWTGDDMMPWGMALVLSLFLIPFVAIGLGLIGHIFYRIAAIFSPIYRLEFSERRLTPGERISISWKRTGGSGQPRRLSLWLVGREEATYRRGTSTTTATSVFYEDALFETETHMMMPAGRVSIDVPADAVPSFRRTHNKILWFVILVADVPGRPDLREEYEIDVKPRDMP